MAQPIGSSLTWALGALAAYGYLIVFLATVLENVFVVGSFTPGDVITAAAAFTATTPEGHGLSPWILIAAATAGSFVGTNISYVVGLRGGRELIERIGPRFGVGLSAIEGGEEYFERHGSQTILLARFVAVLKNLVPALAGASRMNLFWFEVYSLLGSLGYGAILVAVGWFLGANFKVGLKYFGAFSWLLFAFVVAVGVALLVGKRRHDRRLLAENAAEFEEEHPEEAERMAEVADDDAK
jgi:membrane-associated protein